jgi:hypothetical protein
MTLAKTNNVDNTIEVRIGKVTNPLQYLTPGNLIEMLEDSNVLLCALGFHIELSYSDRQAWVNDSPYRHPRKIVSKTGTMVAKLQQGVKLWSCARKTHAYLSEAIQRNKKNIAILKSAGKLAYTYGIIATQNKQSELNIDVLLSPDRYCHKCGQMLSGSINKHMNTVYCRKTSNELEMGSSMKLVSEPSLKNVLLNNPEFGVKQIPIQYEMWAPNWIYDAYMVWRTSNKFAGLSLSEFLKRMMPEVQSTTEVSHNV